MALSQVSIRRWYLVHKWTSLVCTLFLLMFCITGLPLIFHHEIEHLSSPAVQIAAAGESGNPPSLDAMVLQARAASPKSVVTSLFWDPDQPLVGIIMGRNLAAIEADAIHYFDARSGAAVPMPSHDKGVMATLLDIHKSLLMGLPGTLFLGLIGLVFLAAVASGVVVYAPFMRKLPFGTVRKDRSKRVKWLDTHNMVGIVTMGWVTVVGLTGVILTMSTPIALLWQIDEVSQVAAPYKGMPPPEKLASVDAAVASVRAAVPGKKLSVVAWPGTFFATPHHYMIASTGETPLTERLIEPVFVDASTARVTDQRTMPWYVQALFLSVPLHFGDYGGLPLKVIWTLLDIAAIVVLVTGLWLWLKRRNMPLTIRVAEIATGAQNSEVGA